jgi:hypothetical protein
MEIWLGKWDYMPWDWDSRFEQDSHCYGGFRALGHWELVEIWAGGKWE